MMNAAKFYLAEISGVRRQGAESRMRPLTGCSRLCCTEDVSWEACALYGTASAAAMALSTVPKNRKPALLHTFAVFF